MGMAVVRVRCRGQVEEEFGLVMVGGKGPFIRSGLVGQVEVGLEGDSDAEHDAQYARSCAR